MDFTADLIAAPFRMQPGLRRLQAGERQLTGLLPGSALRAEKQAVLQAGAAPLAVPGFDPAPALEAIAEQAAGDGVPLGGGPLQLAVEEDLAVLDGRSGTLPWLSVCVPSHWAPEDKLGRDFAAVHAPVADGDVLRAASAQLVRLATSGERWERHVWTVTPSGRYDQHPRRQPRVAWPGTQDAQAFARACWLRAERQTFFPVGRGTGQAIFTIRVTLTPLVQALDTPQRRERMRAALQSMSSAVLQYKGLAAARDPLLRWLQGP